MAEARCLPCGRGTTATFGWAWLKVREFQEPAEIMEITPAGKSISCGSLACITATDGDWTV